MRIIFLSLFLGLSLFAAACQQAPASPLDNGATPMVDPPPFVKPTAVIQQLADETVVILQKGGDTILIPIDAVLGRAIQMVDGHLVPVRGFADVALPFITPCPCCKVGCDAFCVPPQPCDGTVDKLIHSR